jgi:hypothetical protein
MSIERGPSGEERLEHTHESLRNQREWLVAEGVGEERVDAALEPILEFVEETMLGTDKLGLTDEGEIHE